MFPCFLLLALLASVQGRAVNISNTWVLPEEGFPVFYRYFRDRISWYEADAVCQFHHANLVTVDTTAQYDAVRAYLKELDISSAVWVGLIRSNPDGEFTWTDYRGLSGEGYWSSAPDARAAPLCAAADPAADYRWEARACGGPTVASFICELPVPQWAIGNRGCMVRSLPALTVLYLPESAAVQLTADCGLAGTKRVQCTGNVTREDLLRNLTCADEEPSSVPSIISTSDFDTAFTDLDTSEVTTDMQTSTEDQDDNATTPQAPDLPSLYKKQQVLAVDKLKATVNKLKSQFYKIANLDLIHNNNLQSNDIPKLANNDNYLNLEQSEKLEDEKLLHHKMIHEELARNGNLDTIFTDPMDHFIPPLVMAKAKLSDDMAEMSLAEKHAQQIAEERFTKHHRPIEEKGNLSYDDSENKSITESNDEPQKMVRPFEKKKENEKKDKMKQGIPKKYKEKYESPKGRNPKVTIDNKVLKLDKMETNIFDTQTSQMEKINKNSLTAASPTPLTGSNKTKEDESMDLTVMLKELGMDDSRTSLYTNTSGVTYVTEVTKDINKTHNPIQRNNNTNISDSPTNQKRTTEIPMNHEVIKITIIDENSITNITPTVFEITTRIPEQQRTAETTKLSMSSESLIKNTLNVNNNDTATTNDNNETNINTLAHGNDVQSSTMEYNNNNITSLTDSIKEDMKVMDSKNVTNINILIESNDKPENKTYIEIKLKLKLNETDLTFSEGNSNLASEKTENINLTEIDSSKMLDKINIDPKITGTASPTASPTTTSTPKPHTIEEVLSTSVVTESIIENNDVNNTEYNVIGLKEASNVKNEFAVTQKYNVETNNNTDVFDDKYLRNETESLDAIDDTNSPLLSGASEPIHRPNRSRRPQQPNRLAKFNPFRILG